MFDNEEEYVSPDTISMPEASYEIVQETYQGPMASFEPIKASESPISTSERITFTAPHTSLDGEKKSVSSED